MLKPKHWNVHLIDLTSRLDWNELAPFVVYSRSKLCVAVLLCSVWRIDDGDWQQWLLIFAYSQKFVFGSLPAILSYVTIYSCVGSEFVCLSKWGKGKKNELRVHPLLPWWSFFPLGPLQISAISQENSSIKPVSDWTLHNTLPWPDLKFIFSIQPPSKAVSLYC